MVLAAERLAAPGEVHELTASTTGRAYGNRLSVSLGESAGAAEAESTDEAGVELVGGLAQPKAGGVTVDGKKEGGKSSEASLAQAGLAVLNSYEKVQSKLLKRSRQLRHIHDRPPVPAKGISYDEIPGMIMRKAARDASPDTRVGCEQTCNQYAACLAYSYNEKTQGCLWTTEAFHYDPGTEFFLKKKSADGRVQLDYTLMPGLDVAADGTSPVTAEECKYECSESKSCSGYAFTAKTRTCKQASDKYLEFDKDWLYFEKNVITRLPPKEKKPTEELSELQNKKIVFSRNLDVSKKMFAERDSKAAKKREYLRQLTIDAEEKLKKLQAEQITAGNEYEPYEIAEQSLSDNLKSETDREAGLHKEVNKIKAKIEGVKSAIGAASSKEVSEKSRIDEEYYTKKLSTTKKDIKQVNKDLSLLKPKERDAKSKLQHARGQYTTAIKEYREGKWNIDYDEARAQAAAKEK